MLSISLRFHCLLPDMFCTAFSHAKPPRNIHAAREVILSRFKRRITYGIGCVWGMPSLSPLSSLVMTRTTKNDLDDWDRLGTIGMTRDDLITRNDWDDWHDMDDWDA